MLIERQVGLRIPVRRRRRLEPPSVEQREKKVSLVLVTLVPRDANADGSSFRNPHYNNVIKGKIHTHIL